MTRLMLILLIFDLSAAQVHAQQPPSPPQDAATYSKADLLSRIDFYEAALRKPESGLPEPGL